MFVLFVFMAFIVQATFTFEISMVGSEDNYIARAPYWDDEAQSLFFVNYANGTEKEISRYSPHDGSFYSANIDSETAPRFIIPVRGLCDTCIDFFIVALGQNISLIQWDGISLTAPIISTFSSIETFDPLSMIDYARADRAGRLYVGTTSARQCETRNSSLYLYTPEKGFQQMFTGISTTAGIAINRKDKKLYHLDACSLLVTQFDWDPVSGHLCNGRVAFNLESIGKKAGVSTLIGLEIDNSGLLYISDVTDTTIYVIDPRTKSLVVKFKTDQEITGISFGGPKRDVLFLTVGAAFIKMDSNDTDPKPMTALFQVTGLDVQGPMTTYFKPY